MMTPAVAALDMGYGHLRAALPLVEELGGQLLEVDRPPLADADEARRWSAARRAYESASRGSQMPLVGGIVRRLLDELTTIRPLHPYRDQSAPTRHVRAIERLVRGGLGRGLARRLDEEGRALVATHFAPALSVDVHGHVPVWCLVTDADLARAWVAADPLRSRIHYLAPTQRAARRLLSYGVPRDRVRFTGFPLPASLTGGPEHERLRSDLAARLVRLDRSGLFRESRHREIESVLGSLPSSEEGRPPRVTFAIGGAGAQQQMPATFLPSLRPLVESGSLRVSLVAGVRDDVAERLARTVRDSSLEGAVDVLHATTFVAYHEAFNALLRRTDVLWTKPSELTFYGALGLPLVLSRPVGVHESYNRRWARERGAGLKQRDARHAGQWLSEWLEEGLLCSAAWSGWTQLPSRGRERIADAVRAGS